MSEDVYVTNTLCQRQEPSELQDPTILVMCSVSSRSLVSRLTTMTQVRGVQSQRHYPEERNTVSVPLREVDRLLTRVTRGYRVPRVEILE